MKKVLLVYKVRSWRLLNDVGDVDDDVGDDDIDDDDDDV